MIKFLANVIKWFAATWFMWMARVAVLFAAVFTIEDVLVKKLGYRVEFGALMTVCIISIVTIRIWMPWSTHSYRDEDQGQ